MSDNELILKWLGYTSIDRLNGTRAWVRRDADAYTQVLDTDRERLFLNRKHPADPAWDYLVLLKVRELGIKDRDQFRESLDSLWCDRDRDGMRYIENHLWYQPGDYAEAARFLWERVPTPTTEGE